MTKIKLLLRLRNLIVKTGHEWIEIAEENKEGKDVINQFALPLLSMTTFATFLGSLINKEGFDFETAIKVSTATFVSIYASFYLSALLINSIKPLFHISGDNSKTLVLVAYSYALFITIELITGLFPEFFLLNILILYTIYIIWEGVVPIMKVKEEQRGGFAFVCSLIILVIPYLTSKLLFWLLPSNTVI